MNLKFKTPNLIAWTLLSLLALLLGGSLIHHYFGVTGSVIRGLVRSGEGQITLHMKSSRAKGEWVDAIVVESFSSSNERRERPLSRETLNDVESGTMTWIENDRAPLTIQAKWTNDVLERVDDLDDEPVFSSPEAFMAHFGLTKT